MIRGRLLDLQLDAPGIRQLLRGDDVRLLIDGAAEDILARVKDALPPGTPVSVARYTTDRGAAAVTIADIRGMAWQARDGVLTRAVAQAGLEFKAWQQ
ncbi:hypothetical protein ACFY7Y_14625 [Streptomyces virginiae]|uniref:hypothetical protein n=1 Tax=Streptomyces virginiae TaxID=1961 RepID=UPI0036903417